MVLGAVDRDSAYPPVVSASYPQDVEQLPAPPPAAAANSTTDAVALPLYDVIVSVHESYPLLLTALLERQIADGKQLAAWGEFDLDLKAYGIAAPEGFYKNYRHGVSLDQPLFGGGYLYSGYKVGNGKFQPWFKERQTNEGGEFSIGLGAPLLKDRAIDKRRAAVFQADLARQAVEPAVQAQLLEFVRVASQVYWSWVAAGQTLEAQRELLRNAQARVRQIQERVAAGDLQRIVRINNEQLIAARETKVIESDRKLQETAIKLSLFFRDAAGAPLIPAPARLPETFPDAAAPATEQIEADIARALAASPELVELDLLAEQVCVELRAAENMLLPKLDAQLLASKDVGGPASPLRDKTPFELEAGLYGEVPLQRREARGKLTAAQGKLAQIEAKRRFVTDKIAASVQDAVSALQAAAGRIDRATINLRLARETLELGRLQFDAGDIDLIQLNIYEQAVTDAQMLLISAQADFFAAQADYRAALALDPLE
jgi:outer membrane protein TolC